MKVELERLDGEPEKYRVRVAGEAAWVGIVARSGPAAWDFTPGGDGDKLDEVMTISLHAGTLDELRQVIEARFATMDEAQDRMAASTMEEFATRVLLPISALATTTKSISGMVNALGHQVAVIAATDIVADKREEFYTRFIERVREETTAIVRDREGRAAWEKTLRGFVESIVSEVAGPGGGRGGDGPIKH